MDIEIELKFLVSPTIGPLLTQWVPTFSHQTDQCQIEQQDLDLANTYYDTNDQTLRQHDIGLRTRSSNGVWQQTIKTAGKVIGGLHQRPEYNVPISANQPQLVLFDPAILPPDYPVTSLQAALIPLFTTDFHRHVWLISQPEGVFELVFDVGVITGNDQSTPIAEIELELISGDSGLLFDFARRLVTEFGSELEEIGQTVRLGNHSKAARGYRLVQNKQLEPQASLAQVPLVAEDPLETAFIKTIEYGLSFMQHHEQCFIEQPSLLALRRFTDGVAFIRHGMWLFTMVAPPQCCDHFRAELKWILQAFDWVEHARQLKAVLSKKGIFRKKVEWSTALVKLVDDEVAKDPCLTTMSQFFNLTRYNQFLLDLSQWLLNKGWRAAAIDAQRSEQNLHQVASQLLNESWQALLAEVDGGSPLQCKDYMAFHQQLKHSLMTGSSVGALYHTAIREEFRLPWLDLSRGIDELKTLNLLQQLAQQAAGDEHSLTLSWLGQQIEGLLMAMEQTRQLAVRIRPYWLT